MRIYILKGSKPINGTTWYVLAGVPKLNRPKGVHTDAQLRGIKFGSHTFKV